MKSLAERGAEQAAIALSRMTPAMQAQMKRLCQYIRNTAQRPLSAADFDEDQSPVGPMLREQMEKAGLIEQGLGALMLTDAGESLL